jgi:hypothetical protein
MIDGDCIPIKPPHRLVPATTGRNAEDGARETIVPSTATAGASVPVLLVDVARRPGPVPGRNRGRLESLGNGYWPRTKLRMATC